MFYHFRRLERAKEGIEQEVTLLHLLLIESIYQEDKGMIRVGRHEIALYFYCLNSFPEICKINIIFY